MLSLKPYPAFEDGSATTRALAPYYPSAWMSITDVNKRYCVYKSEFTPDTARQLLRTVGRTKVHLQAVLACCLAAPVEPERFQDVLEARVVVQ